MISKQDIKQALMATDDVAQVDVEGDGYHYQLTVVSDAFKGKPKVARQRWVYSKLKDKITSGSLHAISMQTWTQAEWENQHG